MNQTIWKFECLVGVPVWHEMPEDATVELVLSPTPDMVVMWVRLDPDAPRVPRQFQITGTGQLTNDSWSYVGSCAAALGLMWHLWSRS